jgi:hypothetical protein
MTGRKAEDDISLELEKASSEAARNAMLKYRSISHRLSKLLGAPAVVYRHIGNRSE